MWVLVAAACNDCCACRVLLRVLCSQVREKVRSMAAPVGSACHVSVMPCRHACLALHSMQDEGEAYRLGAGDEEFRDFSSLQLKPDHFNRWVLGSEAVVGRAVGRAAGRTEGPLVCRSWVAGQGK